MRELLDPKRAGRTWNDAYEVEQLLVHPFDETMLKTELDVRVLEAQANLRPALAQWYEQQRKEAATADARRSVLSRVVNDLQWRYTVTEAKRGYSKLITTRTGWIVVLSLILFGGAIWLQLGMTTGHWTLLLVAAAAGAWSAAFSMLTTLKARLDASELNDLKLLRNWTMLISRALIGLGAALIFYFFLSSGLLAGSAFPNLSQSCIDSTASTGGGDAVGGSGAGPGDVASDACGTSLKRLALLVVWCFLAGFSEQLVPGLLAKTEARVMDSQPARERPTLGDTAVDRPAGDVDARAENRAPSAAETLEMPSPRKQT